MPKLLRHVTSALAALIVSSPLAVAQVQNGTPVDRNVGDTGPNAASQRLAQPGLGQFGVGSLLLDRTGGVYQPIQQNFYNTDPRVSQRFLLQSPGITALISRPDYIGPSPRGGWVYNEQTLDGAEALTLTPANTVFVLSPELLRPLSRTPVRPHYENDPSDHPNRVQPRTLSDPYALMRNPEVDRRAYTNQPGMIPQQHNNYRHPEIIERQRKLREERALEAAEEELAKHEKAAANNDEAAGHGKDEDKGAAPQASDDAGKDESSQNQPGNKRESQPGH